MLTIASSPEAYAESHRVTGELRVLELLLAPDSPIHAEALGLDLNDPALRSPSRPDPDGPPTQPYMETTDMLDLSEGALQ